MKKVLLALLLLLMCGHILSAMAEESVIPPQWEVPKNVERLLQVARGELGYREEDHGRSKYGEWAGDPYAQWCAEFLDWCVDQVDQQYGTQMLHHDYPLYSGTNTGKNWFIREGRYICRWGNVENWGYQWLKGDDKFITTGSYIPQPGDWVFFTWTSNKDTDHVAMVEYCTQNKDGSVTIHVIEGNNPVAVKQAEYPLDYNRILGFGTVHECASTTMRGGCTGKPVRILQEKLAYLGYADPEKIDGNFGSGTQSAVVAFQRDHGLRVNGVANMDTQTLLDNLYEDAMQSDPATWRVTDEED